jgi:hypothetical protein
MIIPCQMNAWFCVRVREFANGGYWKQLRQNFGEENNKVAVFRYGKLLPFVNRLD